MSISVGTILKVVTVLNWVDGNIAQNVFGAVVSGTGGPYDEADVVADMLDWVDAMYAELTARISEDITGSEIRVYEYDSVDDDYDEIGSTAWVWEPSSLADYLPSGIALLVNCKTTDPDVNGKKYMAGATDTDCVGGALISAITQDLALFATEWVTQFTGALSGALFTPGVWSPTRTNFFAMSGDVLIPTIPAYQRRRKAGVGI